MKYETRQEVYWKLDNEGLEYALDEMSPDDMPDEEMREALQEAKDGWRRFGQILADVDKEVWG